MDFVFGFITGLIIVLFFYLMSSFILWEFVTIDSILIRMAVIFCVLYGVVYALLARFNS